MQIKINREALLKRMKTKKEKRTKRNYDPKNSIIVKVDKEGVHNFRAVPYPHSPDPAVEPLPERFYHYGLPGGTFFCPKANLGEDCAVCDFVWDRLSATKGTDAAKQWQRYLPSLCMLVPGMIREREDEGCKFLRISTREDRPSDKYNEIQNWFQDDELWQFLDPDEGYDIELTYREPEEGQKAHTGGAKFFLKKIALARKSTKFGTKKVFEEFMKNVPNLDETVFPKKTTEDSYAVLEKWTKLLERKAKRNGYKSVATDDSTGTDVTESNDSEEASEKPETTKMDSVSAKLDQLGM